MHAGALQDDGSRKFTWAAEDEAHYLGEDLFKEFGITMKVRPCMRIAPAT